MTSVAGWYAPQAFTDGGDPLVSGRLYTYTQGTTTHKAAYTDKAGLVPHTYVADGGGGQYIALNARGELPAPLYLAAGAYDVALKRADGSTVWTRRADPIDEAQTLLASAALASGGAGMVGFGIGVAYPVNTVGAKLAQWISPEDFGAVGDGVTNDAAAFQLAVTAAANGVLFLPGGSNYRLNSKVTIAAPLVIIGYGAKINTGAAHITGLEVTSSNVSILGVEVIGAGSGSYNTNGRLIVVQGVDNGAALAPTRITDVSILGCRLHAAGRSAVRAQYVQRMSVVGCSLYDLAFAGVENLSCKDVKILGNEIRDITPGTGGNMYGVYCSQTNSADVVRNPVSEGFKVLHNSFENIDWEGLDCHGGNDLDFSHNTFRNCGDSNAAIAIIHADDEVSTPIVPATNVRVVGNAISGSQNYGIAASSASASVIHKNISIAGNTLENCGRIDLASNRGGIRLGSAQDVSVIGNTLSFCGPYGVVINDQYAGNVSVLGNTFVRMVSNVVTTPSPVLIDRGASGAGAIVVGGNTLRTAALGETYENVSGVRVVATDGGNIRLGVNQFDVAATKYSLTAAQWAGASDAVANMGDDVIAVTTATSFVAKVITLPKAHSSNTLYNPTAVISGTTGAGNERTLLHCVRTSTTQITVTAYTANGANFPANGNINFFWRTSGV